MVIPGPAFPRHDVATIALKNKRFLHFRAAGTPFGMQRATHPSGARDETKSGTKGPNPPVQGVFP